MLSFLVPSRCAACGTPREDTGGGGLCGACWRSLPTLESGRACPHCALPTGGLPCARCATVPPPVHRASAVGPYAGVLKKLVSAYKFRGFDILAAPAGDLLARAARAAGIDAADALVPVPSTRRRNRERGYDPARLLAEETARRLALPVRALLARRRETPPQSGLPAAARDANVSGAFRARACAGARLLLVDDVLTTGATAFSAARALREAGASRVDLLVLARTPSSEADSSAETA